MTLFDKAFDLVIGLEGGYSNNSSDPGGETKFGISKKSYPNLNIKDLTLDQAREIYLIDYWNKYSCNLLPDRLAILYFDCAVNQGPTNAVKLLQQHLGVASDGVLGSKTEEAMIEAKPELDFRFMTLREFKYRANPNFNIFGKGWINRLFELCMKVN